MFDDVEQHIRTTAQDDMKSEENKKVCTLRNSGGLRKTPTPGGVPVRMMSPGFNVMNLIKNRYR